MSEMIERVAKAINDAGYGHTGEMPHSFFEELSPREKGLLLAMARAAIEAMREPTYEMLQRGHENNFGYCPTQAWKAMIEEALK
jgi:hypothetical protein